MTELNTLGDALKPESQRLRNTETVLDRARNEIAAQADQIHGLTATVSSLRNLNGTQARTINDLMEQNKRVAEASTYHAKQNANLKRERDGLNKSPVQVELPFGLDKVESGLEKPDDVNHPDHYTAGGIEAIKVIRAKLTTEQWHGYLLGNALKYLQRCNHKGQFDKDVAKAQVYTRWMLEDNVPFVQEESDADA